MPTALSSGKALRSRIGQNSEPGLPYLLCLTQGSKANMASEVVTQGFRSFCTCVGTKVWKKSWGFKPPSSGQSRKGWHSLKKFFLRACHPGGIFSSIVSLLCHIPTAKQVLLSQLIGGKKTPQKVKCFSKVSQEWIQQIFTWRLLCTRHCSRHQGESS